MLKDIELSEERHDVRPGKGLVCMTEKEKTDRDGKLNELLFGVRRSVRYHCRRRMFFDRVEKTNKFLTVFSGSGTVASVIASSHYASIGFGIMVAVFASVDLVVGPCESARTHHDLARRFIELEGKIILAGSEPTLDQVHGFIIDRLKIEADEPLILRVLDVLCHNELVQALGYDPSEKVKVTCLQRWLAQVVTIGQHKLKKINEA